MTQASPSRTSSHPSDPPSPTPSAPPPSLSCPSKACALCLFVDAPSSVDIDKFNCRVASCRTKYIWREAIRTQNNMNRKHDDRCFRNLNNPYCVLLLVYGWLLYILTMCPSQYTSGPSMGIGQFTLHHLRIIQV